MNALPRPLHKENTNQGLGDLHCHTVLSDGGLTPEEVFALAKAQGIKVLALTDHDHITENPERTAAAKSVGIQLLPAVELSTTDYSRKRKVHLLCYLPKNRAAMDEYCRSIAEQRGHCGEEMLRLVQKKYPVPQEAVCKYAQQSSALFKQHIVRAMMDYGWTQQLYGSLFQELFGKEGIARVPIAYPDVFEAARFAKECGAVVVMAHPYVYRSLDVMEELTEQGLLDGIEARHSRCTAEGEAYLTEYAEAHGLLTTGGSDFHGFYSSVPCMLADRTTTQKELEQLFLRSDQKGC